MALIARSTLATTPLACVATARLWSQWSRPFSASPRRKTAPRRTQDFSSGYTSGYDPTQETGRGPIFSSRNMYGVPQFYPRDLKRRVDEYVVGQDRAKRTIASIVFNHYQKLRRRNHLEEQDRLRQDKLRRQKYALDKATARAVHQDDVDGLGEARYRDLDDSPAEGAQCNRTPASPFRYITDRDSADVTSPDHQDGRFQESLSNLVSNFYNQDDGPSHVKIDKSNILLIGPTGVGKTYILETLSKRINVPFAICDCNTFTQAGYIGADVETCLERLLIEANYDSRAAEHGIIVLDEFDKIARREGTTTRDVGGEGVQQALLKLVEGTKVTLNVKSDGGARSNQSSPSTSSFGSAVRPVNPSGGAKMDQYTIDTSNILFVFCGAFVGLERAVLARVAKPGMGFGSTLRPSSSASMSASLRDGARDDRRKRDVLPLEMYTHLPHQPTSLANLSPSSHEHPFTPLDLASPQDLQSFGFIPELIGRLHNIISLSPLSVNDLYRILTEPRNSLLSQYTTLFETYPSTLRFTQKALKEIARRAARSETGARGLRMEMERVLAEAMFDAPMPYVLVTEDCVKGKSKACYWGKDGRFEIERRSRDEDDPGNSTTLLEEQDFEEVMSQGGTEESVAA